MYYPCIILVSEKKHVKYTRSASGRTPAVGIISSSGEREEKYKLRGKSHNLDIFWRKKRCTTWPECRYQLQQACGTVSSHRNRLVPCGTLLHHIGKFVSSGTNWCCPYDLFYYNISLSPRFSTWGGLTPKGLMECSQGVNDVLPNRFWYLQLQCLIKGSPSHEG